MEMVGLPDGAGEIVGLSVGAGDDVGKSVGGSVFFGNIRVVFDGRPTSSSATSLETL